jgi:ABC-type cobalamin/Fe3+-siderophores transport system ATPase subunit
MKLMLVGKENVGKTSLLRALTRTNGSSTRGRVAAAKVPIAQTLSTPAAYYARSLSLLRYSHIYSFAYHGVVRREVPRRSLAANVAFSGSAVFRVDSAVYSA